VQRVLVSTCLLGLPARYNGELIAYEHPVLRRWQAEGRIVAFCPEVAGGLPTPRPPAEVAEGKGGRLVLAGEAKVIDKTGADVTEPFLRGARLAQDLVRTRQIRIAILKDEDIKAGGDEFSNLDIKVERTYDIEQVVAEVSAYVQEILDDMDVEARIESSHDRRTINIQVDTNEPGRVIGYHGKVLKSLQLLAQNFLYNRYERNFYITINVNDYVEHRAEVLQGYAQKLAERVLEDQEAYHTDPMSSSERKIIHRIISKMPGLTSYSEGSEPNRYVVVDIEGNND
jgi:predicted RNA-binding protein Jag